MDGKRTVKTPTNLNPSSIKDQPYPENQSHDADNASLREDKERAKCKDTGLLDDAIKVTKSIRTKQRRNKERNGKESGLA